MNRLTFLIAATLLALPACNPEPRSTAAPVSDSRENTAVAAPAAAPVIAATAQVAEPFATFWHRFRKAALASDTRGIVAESAPRVITHGILDDDLKEEIAAEAVPALVGQLLASDERFEASDRSLREGMVSGDIPDPVAGEPKDQRRIGPFVFHQVDGRWRLSEVYRIE